MTTGSDRSHDAFDNPWKMACREGNLRALRDAAYLLWEDGGHTRLRCDWCELMGETGLLTLALLERERVLAERGFVGIDLDPVRIARFREERPDLKWVSGNLFALLASPELANVGILNLDSYKVVGNPAALGDFGLVRGLARKALDRFGEFALFVNADLDAVLRLGQRRGPALQTQANMFAGLFRDVLPRRELEAEALLPANAVPAIDAGETGTFGAFEVYRGSASGHRMANLRVVLR